MAEFVEYVAKQGDRWDTIAFKAYGDALAYDEVKKRDLISGIIDANPAITISAILEIGTRVIVPILEQGDIQIDSELLPPWKR